MIVRGTVTAAALVALLVGLLLLVGCGPSSTCRELEDGSVQCAPTPGLEAVVDTSSRDSLP